MGGRPAKSVSVSSGRIGQEEKSLRVEVEQKLRGQSAVPEPPAGLTAEQAALFRFIASELEESGILGTLDVFVLESTAVAIDRIRTINAMVDEAPNLLYDRDLQNTRAKYQSDLWRGCNELCLSPQARAKIGSLAAQAARKEKKDPLLAALEGDV